MQIWNKKHFWWKEQPQRPETKIVTVYIRGGKRAGVVGAEWAWREEEEDLEALVKRCHTHVHRRPHQPRGCLQRAECNFRTV